MSNRPRTLNPYGWMISAAYKGHVAEAYDGSTGEWIATKLAEAYFAAHEGEDDGEHSRIWDVAITAAAFLTETGVTSH